ncbi:MAG TPA: alpha/beta fold hydrolase [Pseudidiomarina sp.]|nr:alpha/beta fold hydrolase [Pseudidiomarina sp.]
MPETKPTDNDSNWSSFYDEIVAPFWCNNVKHIAIERPDGVTLYAHYLNLAHSRGIIVVSPGRIEAAIKYQEFVWEMAQAGYSVALLDHRGQGESDRESPFRQRGHIQQFDSFVSDFAAFMADVTERFSTQPITLVGHSMGSAIAALYLARYEHQVARAVLSSPMFGIRSNPIPARLALAIAEFGLRLNEWLQPNKPWYFPARADYQDIPFAKNDLTHSPARYAKFRQLYEQHPNIQLGGPTFAWVVQALRACTRVEAEAQQITIPVTLVQSGGDTVVDNQSHQRVLELLPQGRLISIPNARHELFIEADEYREQALAVVLEEAAQVTAAD